MSKDSEHQADHVAAAHFLPGGRCVLLRHTLADDSLHVDWLSESISDGGDAKSRDPDARTLIAFRLPAALNALLPGESLAAQRMPDHRRLYLEYEGPISGDRGFVARIAKGEVIHASHDADLITRLQVRWHRTVQREGVLQTLILTQRNRGEVLVHCENCEIVAQ